MGRYLLPVPRGPSTTNCHTTISVLFVCKIGQSRKLRNPKRDTLIYSCIGEVHNTKNGYLGHSKVHHISDVPLVFIIL